MIVVDIEATCWEDEDPRRSLQRSISEVIEIGAVKIGRDFKRVSEFSKFIRPLKNPMLSDYCKNLTTITQEQVDSADCFDTVWKEFLDWCGDDCVMASWGQYDINQLSRQSADCKLQCNFAHINMKDKFGGRGLGVTARSLGIDFSGPQHRALVDARAVADIFILKTKR